jgi:hypothetical protein
MSYPVISNAYFRLIIVHILTAWSILLQKLMIAELDKDLSTVCGIRRFVIVFARELQ